LRMANVPALVGEAEAYAIDAHAAMPAGSAR
jgi:hypothetical protein